VFSILVEILVSSAAYTVVVKAPPDIPAMDTSEYP